MRKILCECSTNIAYDNTMLAYIHIFVFPVLPPLNGGCSFSGCLSLLTGGDAFPDQWWACCLHYFHCYSQTTVSQLAFQTNYKSFHTLIWYPPAALSTVKTIIWATEVVQANHNRKVSFLYEIRTRPSVAFWPVQFGKKAAIGAL